MRYGYSRHLRRHHTNEFLPYLLPKLEVFLRGSHAESRKRQISLINQKGDFLRSIQIATKRVGTRVKYVLYFLQRVHGKGLLIIDIPPAMESLVDIAQALIRDVRVYLRS